MCHHRVDECVYVCFHMSWFILYGNLRVHKGSIAFCRVWAMGKNLVPAVQSEKPKWLL